MRRPWTRRSGGRPSGRGRRPSWRWPPRCRPSRSPLYSHEPAFGIRIGSTAPSRREGPDDPSPVPVGPVEREVRTTRLDLTGAKEGETRFGPVLGRLGPDVRPWTRCRWCRHRPRTPERTAPPRSSSTPPGAVDDASGVSPTRRLRCAPRTQGCWCSVSSARRRSPMDLAACTGPALRDSGRAGDTSRGSGGCPWLLRPAARPSRRRRSRSCPACLLTCPRAADLPRVRRRTPARFPHRRVAPRRRPPRPEPARRAPAARPAPVPRPRPAPPTVLRARLLRLRAAPRTGRRTPVRRLGAPPPATRREPDHVPSRRIPPPGRTGPAGAPPARTSSPCCSSWP